MVVPVLIISCHVSLKPNRGPLTAHNSKVATAITNATGRPAICDVHFANRVKKPVDFVEFIVSELLPPAQLALLRRLGPGNKISKRYWNRAAPGASFCLDPQSSASTRNSRSVLKFTMSIGASAMHAAKNLSLFFHTMPDDPASTMRTLRRERLNGAFETVENVAFVPDDYFESLIVVISADFTCRHFCPFVL